MAPPKPPPRPTPTHVRTGSARAAFEHPIEEEEEIPEEKLSHMRKRLDSAGSTRGAFFKAPATSKLQQQEPPTTKRKKKSPRKAASMEPKNISSNALHMGNMASLAIAGLDDLGGYMDGGGMSPLDRNSKAPPPKKRTPPPKNRQPQQSLSYAERTAMANRRPPAMPPHPFSQSVESPESDVENPRLDTIPDDTSPMSASPPTFGNYLPQDVYNTGAHSRGVHRISERTVEISERSLDLYSATAPSPLVMPPRTESLTFQYSAGSADGSSLAPRSRDALTTQYSAGSLGDSFSLHGANIAMDANNNSLLNNMPAPMPYWGGYQQNAMPPPGSQPYAAAPPMQDTAAQQQDIMNFSSMVHADYGTNLVPRQGTVMPPLVPQVMHDKPASEDFSDDEDDDEEDESLPYDEELEGQDMSFMARVKRWFDPTDFLLSDLEYDEDGNPINDDPDHMGWTLPGVFRHFLYNPEFPEFTSLQQFSWAIILGIVMGVYTAVWKNVIEECVNFMWNTVPAALLKAGVFTDLHGSFPLPHYMWICPAFFSGLLSYIFVILPTKIPGQNEWIQALHSRGVQDHETFWPLWVLSTAGMASGLSLGPELPLVLTAGMIGSWLGVICKQSMLQARVMNITAASAAVGGFFGFPMAGAMFVLEIPHRMGLQYFEALSPATIASILAVLVNRMIVNNDVTGYYTYPFLTEALPSHIFTTAVIYGLVGSGVGVGYAEGVMFLKHFVHDLFSTHHHHKHDPQQSHHGDAHDGEDETHKMRGGARGTDEKMPLVGNAKKPVHRQDTFFEKVGALSNKVFSFGIKHEPTRAAVAGTLAGIVVGVTCMFVPHVTFWGESQLQTLIDKGRTPLPVFGEEEKSTSIMTAYGYCLIDPTDETAVAAGFSIGCAALITTAKIFVTGLSLGTGIIGGHFWGPLFVGCAASHLLTDLATLMQEHLGFGEGLATYPCVSILCMMGSTHVVTFRAHMAIMLILTLTISAFDQGNSKGTPGYTAGDYSAVFPLLVVSVFVSLMISRDTVFYSAQRSRGDIMALPEVLCEPGKEGQPMIMNYDDDRPFDDFDEYDSMTESDGNDDDNATTESSRGKRIVNMNLNEDDIEKAFQARQRASMSRSDSDSSREPKHKRSGSSQVKIAEDTRAGKEEPPPIPPPPKSTVPDGRSWSVVIEHDEHPSRDKLTKSAVDLDLPSKRLDELLSKPLEPRFRPRRGMHRRIHSAPDGSYVESSDLSHTPLITNGGRKPNHNRTGSIGGMRERSDSVGGSSRASTPPNDRLVHVTSFGELSEFQPSLIDQARRRASSMHTRNPSLPRIGRHSRQNSNASAVSGVSATALTMVYTDASGALSSDDVERSFNSVVNQQSLSQTQSGNLSSSIWSSGGSIS